MSRQRFSPAAIAVHLLVSALASSLIVAIAMSGMFVGMAPRLISETLEPLSLLMLPGLLFAIASVGPHDFKPLTVFHASLVFWFVFSFLFLTWRARTLDR